MGCGSGRFTVNFQKRGYDVYGVDKSPEMLNMAVRYAKNCGADVRYVLGYVLNFKFIKPPQNVTAMCDTFNYIKDPYPAFKNIYNSLECGGIFIFDISTEYKLIQILGNNTYSDTRDDITYIWNNFLDKKLTKVDMELTFFEKEGLLYKKSVEKQCQYVHNTEKLLSLLKDAGFEAEVYSGMSKLRAKPTDERVHFVAVKK